MDAEDVSCGKANQTELQRQFIFLSRGVQFDGFDTVENMNRCVNNNYTFQGFWR
jgi:hypothetical protein